VTTVADAGPLIHLSWVGQLDILYELFGEIVIPEQVRAEIFDVDPSLPGIRELERFMDAGRLHVQPVVDRAYVRTVGEIVDPGEAEVIALAAEVQPEQVLMDDRHGRKYAESVGLDVLGTIGILQRARERGIVEAVLPLALELRRSGFWIGGSIIESVRREEA